jgi:hypothetical protein
LLPGRQRRRPPLARLAVLVVVTSFGLAAPATASAHSRRPAVALDYRLRVTPSPIPGVRAEVLDADRELRLTVRPSASLLVRGLLGEPMLRFDRRGVWVNDGSVTAATDRLARPGAKGWRRITAAHTFAWHDHRLSPPRLRAGETAPWSLPVELSGRAVSIQGSFLRVARPALWPWLAVFALALAGLVIASRRPSRHRERFAVGAAALAAATALALTAGFTAGDPLSGTEQWLELGCTAVLAAAAAAALAARDAATRSWSASAIGAVAFAFALPPLGVFWHGVVVSSLPAVLVRALNAVALLAGISAVVLGIGSAEAEPSRGTRRAKHRSLLQKGT